MFTVKKCRQLTLSLAIQVERFENKLCVQSFRTGGSEAYDNMAVISKLQLRFLKLI